MVHPLYHRARGWVGQTVTAYHVNGTVHQGTLVGVAPHGIYLVPNGRAARLMAYQATNDETVSLQNEDVTKRQGDAQLVYAPAGYFAFGALAGLGLGAALGGLWW